MSLTDAEREKFTEMYQKYDTNGDGLAFTELVPLLRDMGWTEDKYSDADLADKFLDADKDNTRLINQEELLELINQKPRTELNESNLRRIFKQIDQDGSGKINAEEFRQALEAGGCQATLSDINEMITAADNSGDGMIDFKELCSSCGF
ncbi:calmodulin-like protein 3 [Liolophura sinensis]|uniref:calmodulin-like protein 3 n=1 Tax=Liolophura sinensis TaxID=3198878 RepID=UPI0031594B2A